MTIWNGVLWLHLVAMGFFVGGQLMLAAIVVPVLRASSDPTALRAVPGAIFAVSLAIVWLGIVVAG